MVKHLTALTAIMRGTSLEVHLERLVTIITTSNSPDVHCASTPVEVEHSETVSFNPYGRRSVSRQFAVLRIEEQGGQNSRQRHNSIQTMEFQANRMVN
jgi:hypothetical protein